MEEKPAELQVSEQEVQMDKLKLHKFKILTGILGVLVLAGAVFGAYKLGQKQIRPGLQPIPTPLPSEAPAKEGDSTANWKTYQTNNFSIKHPSDWKIATQQIEYYNSLTLVFTKEGGKKTSGGYEFPQFWIGSFEIYSTSGAICANEPYCEEVGKINFQIKDKKYSSPIFERKVWTGGKELTGNEPSFYVFQTYLENVPSNPTVTGQFDTSTSQSEIEKILSSINF